MSLIKIEKKTETWYIKCMNHIGLVSSWEERFFFIVTIIPIEIPDSCRKIHIFMLCGLWNVAHEGSQNPPLPWALASTTPLVELDETD